MASLARITLPHKSSAALAYHFFPAPQPSVPRLAVFLNGMVAPQMAWHPVISLLQQDPREPSRTFAYLTYDRYGQGPLSEPDPVVVDPVYGHDVNVVVSDLEALLSVVGETHLGSASPELVLIGNSIGCAVARQYAATYPNRVSGIILLDSVLANSDFNNDVFPDPSSSSFDEATLPRGLSVDDLVKARDIAFKMFSPTNPNKEGFDRRNMKDLLPSASEPKLVGTGGKGPYLTVVGHEPEKFNKESEQRMGMPAISTREYTQPIWEKYNAGLLEISEREPGNTVKIAPGAGHFVQVDNPTFVAQELDEILQKAGWW